VLHGRLEEAEKVVSGMESFARNKGLRLAAPKPEELSSEHGRFPTSYLFQKKYAYRLLTFASMWFFWYIGNYGFLGDAATLLSAHGATVANSILFLAVGAIGYPVGAVIMMMIADRFERKRLVLASTLVWFVGMVFIALSSSGAFTMIGSFLASLALGLYLQVAYTFTSESYPTRARSSGFALSDGIGHIGGAIGALALPLVVSELGFSFGFIFIGITGVIAGLIALAGPSVTRLKLEQISK
jgi:MFS family permease